MPYSGVRSGDLDVPFGAEIALTFVTEAAFFKGRVAGVDAVDEAARRGSREVLVGIPDGRGIPDLGASIGATRARAGGRVSGLRVQRADL